MINNKIALFPGSFDPITKGHDDIVLRALKLFDKIIIGLADNHEKKSLFSYNKRLSLLNSAFKKNNRVKVINYKGLTANYCYNNNIRFIVRGIRNEVDFNLEKTVDSTNKLLNTKLETVSFFTKTEFSNLSSSILRDIYVNGGDIKSFLPDTIDVALLK